MAAENQLVAEESGELFGIGHNRPPLSELILAEIAPFRPTHRELVDIAKSAVIVDEESAGKVTDLTVKLRGVEDELDAVRERMVRPYLAAQREINSSFNNMIAELRVLRAGEDGRGGLRRMLTIYETRREEAAQAERDRLRAEQRQREAEAEVARKAAEEKRQAGSGSVADELAAMQAQESADRLQRRAEAIRPEPTRSHLGQVNMRREISFQITDIRKALGWLLKSPFKSQIEQAARTIFGKHLRTLGVAAIEAGVEIPGIEAKVEKQAGVSR